MNIKTRNFKANIFSKIKKELNVLKLSMAALSTVSAIFIGSFIGIIINFFKSKTK